MQVSVINQQSPVGFAQATSEKSETTGTLILVLTFCKILNPSSNPIPLKLSGEDLLSFIKTRFKK